MSDDVRETPDGQPPVQPVPSADAPTGDAPATPGAGYRVALDAYCGPLDLLLYLIRKSEVDINDIPVAHITEQYQRHIDLMAEINVNIAGEFLVMAATLMEIKSRMLLPREEGLEGEEEEDPRAELVRQLLEYKRYKDLARELGARAAQQAMKFPRPDLATPQLEPAEGADEKAETALAGIGLWELIDAFAKVLSETSIGPPQEQLLERERPLHEFRRDLLEFVRSEKQTTFSRVFANCKSRDEMIATFIALLELVRLQQLMLQQAGDLGELYVALAEDRPQPAPAAPPQPRPEPEAQPEAPATGRFKPVNEVDVFEELEEEAESLGRARERIEAAIDGAEAFLKQHHEQARQEEQSEEGEPEPPPGPAAPPPHDDATQPPADPNAAPEPPRPQPKEEDPPRARENPTLD